MFRAVVSPIPSVLPVINTTLMTCCIGGDASGADTGVNAVTNDDDDDNNDDDDAVIRTTATISWTTTRITTRTETR